MTTVDANSYLDARSEILELRATLGEANAEIDRHHRDFKRIQKLLDSYESVHGPDSGYLLYQIRNIVG